MRFQGCCGTCAGQVIWQCECNMTHWSAVWRRFRAVGRALCGAVEWPTYLSWTIFHYFGGLLQHNLEESVVDAIMTVYRHVIGTYFHARQEQHGPKK